MNVDARDSVFNSHICFNALATLQHIKNVENCKYIYFGFHFHAYAIRVRVCVLFFHFVHFYHLSTPYSYAFMRVLGEQRPIAILRLDFPSFRFFSVVNLHDLCLYAFGGICVCEWMDGPINP